jgi:DNA polymerase IV
MDYQTSLPFNQKPSQTMHIDLNSCFARVEQQANPRLRGKPIAVAAYTTPSGCILAPSQEAKERGVKTGMRVKEGRLLCPELIVLPPDPAKYRHVHLALKHLLRRYTDDVHPKSIDEFVLNFGGSPALKSATIHDIALEIKARLRHEVGDWLRVSIGLAPNRFLAKTAAGIRKPDGLEEINHANALDIYATMKLTDLHGINVRNAARLNSAEIFTVREFYHASPWQLRRAFGSICGHYWYYRLRGWEIDDVEPARKSFGNSYSLPTRLVCADELAPILRKLVDKTGNRMRRAGYQASGVHVSLVYRDRDFWHRGTTAPTMLFDSRDIYREAFKLLCKSPQQKGVRTLAFSCFDLRPDTALQLELFDDVQRKAQLVDALDDINGRYGTYVITPGMMIGTEDTVPDRISFGGIKELEDIIFAEEPE